MPNLSELSLKWPTLTLGCDAGVIFANDLGPIFARMQGLTLNFGTIRYWNLALANCRENLQYLRLATSNWVIEEDQPANETKTKSKILFRTTLPSLKQLVELDLSDIGWAAMPDPRLSSSNGHCHGDGS